MNLYVVFSYLPLVSYGIVYWILAMVTRLWERNIPYFFRFFKYNPRTGSSSTGFTLLKLRSKDSIKRDNFCICHLHVMVCCFEIKKTGTWVPYITLIIFFVFRVLCRRWALKRWALYVVLKHSFLIICHWPVMVYMVIKHSFLVIHHWSVMVFSTVFWQWWHG